jgi:hypothetical protein
MADDFFIRGGKGGWILRKIPRMQKGDLDDELFNNRENTKD